MLIPTTLRTLATLALGGALAAALGAAHATAFNPPINMVHGIEYMSGGVDTDEAQLMETVLPRWPASFVFSVQGQAPSTLASEVEVTVRSASGEVLLDHVRAGGPFMVARLAPGTYQVEAVVGGKALTQEVTVRAGEDTRTEFTWPEGTAVRQARS